MVPPGARLRILDHVVEHVADAARSRRAPKLEGRNMTMVLAPDKKAKNPEANDDEPAEPATALRTTANGDQPTA